MLPKPPSTDLYSVVMTQAVFPLRKFYIEQMFVLFHAKRMQLRNHADTTSEAFPTLKELCDIYV